MRKALVVLLGVCLLALIVGSVSARDLDSRGKRVMEAYLKDDCADLIDPGTRSLQTSAAADTYRLVWYDFEQMNWMNWTPEDFTLQIDTFFHIDDFIGLSGGNGHLLPLEGSYSMWCGARPGPHSDLYMCGWVNPPGYANNWDQYLQTDAFTFTGYVDFTFHGWIDSEEDWDYTYVEYDTGDDNWVRMHDDPWDHDGGEPYDTIHTHTFFLARPSTKIRFHFSADGAWSDQDGEMDTDGAIIVDELLIEDAVGTINYEDFEDDHEGVTGGPGDKRCGIWWANIPEPYGDYCGLATNLMDKDPCNDNFTTQIIFFEGSDQPSTDYPGLYDVPFCRGEGGIDKPCINNVAISPPFSMEHYTTNRDEVQDTAIPGPDLPELGRCELWFDIYGDLPEANRMYYQWSVREVIDECPQKWDDEGYVYYATGQTYGLALHDISDYVGAGDTIQVALGVSDMCWIWYEEGDCVEHTPAPYVDNVRIYRSKTSGPNWTFRDLELFQDNWPTGDPTLPTSYVRADCAQDIGQEDMLTPLDIGDSITVDCAADMAGGLDTLVTGEAEIYCYIKCDYIGAGTKPEIYGPTMAGQYGSYVADDGSDWTQFLMEPAINKTGAVVADTWMFDLNDSLFTYGYKFQYYFKAKARDGYESTLPPDAEVAGGDLFEWTTLPTLNTRILFVDDYHGRGAAAEKLFYENSGTVQLEWDAGFAAVIPDYPDRYDMNNPSSNVSNGLESRISLTMLQDLYEKIIWDSGNMSGYTICEGSNYSDKCDDCALLHNWLETTADHKVCLLVMGEDLAWNLGNAPSGSSAYDLLNSCGVNYIRDSYYAYTGGDLGGGITTPLITGDGVHPNFGSISHYAYGGCPTINRFDMLEPQGSGAAGALYYPDFDGNGPYYAGILRDDVNTYAQALKTLWVGYSLQYIRNVGSGVPARNLFIKAVFDFFNNDTNFEITDSGVTPKVFSLAQNFPNPFNPATRIKFTLPKKSHVSLKIYNVAGQLVKTLRNDVMEVGSHEVTWDGTNNIGASVASGVYFYKMKAGADYENVKKMILLR
jgi:hypothetical protein